MGDDWLRWALVAASFVLPYVAVVAANTRRSLTIGAPEASDLQRPALGPPRV